MEWLVLFLGRKGRVRMVKVSVGKYGSIDAWYVRIDQWDDDDYLGKVCVSCVSERNALEVCERIEVALYGCLDEVERARGKERV